MMLVHSPYVIVDEYQSSLRSHEVTFLDVTKLRLHEQMYDALAHGTVPSMESYK